ncbi:MAG: hypothetical protein C5B58_04035 [Acidobacteria bacterium]|nr:MAG: hypothetical protein C5B58_04035 [Acidobacteriota bacterium]
MEGRHTPRTTFPVHQRRLPEGFERLPPSVFKPPKAMDVFRAANNRFASKEETMADHQQVALEDSHRAHQLQAALLPKCGLRMPTWETYYDYAPAWVIGGDYCDLVAIENDLFFVLGDAVGKGTAGAMIASQLHALFRALLPLELPLDQLVERVNRILCESGAEDYYASVVCGRASSSGGLKLVNAGHLPPLLLRSGQALPIFASGPPLGLFPTSSYNVKEIRLVGGETLFLCTDGVTEARNLSDSEYGLDRLASIATARSHLRPDELVKACVDDVAVFSCDVPPFDDRTVMALQYQ